MKFFISFILALSLCLPTVASADQDLGPSVEIIIRDSSGSGFYSAGTGWLIDGDTITTAAHVDRYGSVSYISIGGLCIPVHLAYADRLKDIAFYKIDAVPGLQRKLLSSIPIRPFAQSWRAGDPIHIVGFPISHSFNKTDIKGILSDPYVLIPWSDNSRTSLNGLATFGEDVSPGFSGSPVYNEAEQVVGMILGRYLNDEPVGIIANYWDIQDAYEKYKNPPVIPATVVSIEKGHLK